MILSLNFSNKIIKLEDKQKIVLPKTAFSGLKTNGLSNPKN